MTLRELIHNTMEMGASLNDEIIIENGRTITHVVRAFDDKVQILITNGYDLLYDDGCYHICYDAHGHHYPDMDNMNEFEPRLGNHHNVTWSCVPGYKRNDNGLVNKIVTFLNEHPKSTLKELCSGIERPPNVVSGILYGPSYKKVFIKYHD